MEINYQDFDFKSRLIKRYLNYELSENDVMVILVSDELLKDEPNRLLTADSLAPFMHLSPDEIDACLARLMQKKVISMEKAGNSYCSSLVSFKKKLFDDFIKDTLLRQENGKVVKADNEFYDYVQHLQGSKEISSVQRQYLSRWLQDGVSQSRIKEALEKSLRPSGISFSSADKRIRERQRSQGRSTIGTSTVNEKTGKKVDYSDLFNNEDWTIDSGK